MIAVLLCAGFATRLYPLSRDFPKPLLPVAGRPVIDHLLDQIVGLPGIESIHIVTNARFYEHFTRWRRNWQACLAPRDITIKIYNDGTTANENRLGACADLQLVFRQAGRAGAYLVSAGDNIYLFRIADLWRRFLCGHRHCVIALAENDPETLKNTGVPVFGESDRVLGLLEKPDNPSPGWFCPPLYFLQPTAREVLEDFLDAVGPVDAPGHFIDYLCHREAVTAIKLNEKRLDIGNLESYHRADRILRDCLVRE
ncbi:MAG: sugar phosphate nucleotidyltransferase [Desulfobacterales bacterium]|jgi:glucose-1-phosphate thymidylyltransferase